WPDTFNNYFHPEVAHAAWDVLNATGWNVRLPSRILCCGRPLYDFGMLSLAKSLLREVLDVLRDEIRAGTPVVVLEPSCASVFRDELKSLFPRDEDALRLSRQTVLLSEFLERYAPAFSVPSLHGRAVVQKHCHHASVLGFSAEERVLK